MTLIKTSVLIPAPQNEVWASVSDLASHVNWMQDAAAIHFRSDQRAGVGTVFDCETRIGPLTTTDQMTVTTWREQQEIGVKHSGLVSGEGRFELTDQGGKTLFTWTEQLHFPMRFGGRVGEYLARPLFTLIWRRNLKALRKTFES